MSTPKYKGTGQPTSAVVDGLSGWLGGILGGAATPGYRMTTTASPAPAPTAPNTLAQSCPPCVATSMLTVLPAEDADDAPDPSAPMALDDSGDAVIPVGPGPITIVINPRA